VNRGDAPFGDFNIVHPSDYAAHGYPHHAWTWMRREDPVYWWDRTEGIPFWAITKHADIVAISKQPERFLSGPRLTISHQPERPMEEFPPTLIQMDPPQHGMYRKMVQKRFSPRALERIHADIERIGREIVDSLGKEIADSLARDTSGECDFVEKVAAPLPIAVIAWLLGVPRSDWNLLFDWTNRTIGADDPDFQREGKTPDETAREAMIELFGYFTKLVEEKRKNPADDLVTLFSQLEVDGEPLPMMDVLAWCLIIVIAGNETTRNATSGGMLALIEHPEELRKLQVDPGLLPSAIDEVVRWVSPIIHFARTASEDYELRGKQIRKGDALALFYASANRDEEVFDEPFRFQVGRRPNRHLGFGIGEHFCLGAHLARLELQVAYRHLLPRIEEIELAGPVERLHSSMVGGVKQLPIRYKLRSQARRA
jgi:cytochrome P450